MLTEQSQCFTLVFAAHHTFEHIILAFYLFLLAISDVTTNQKYDCHHNKSKHTEETGVKHNECNQGTNSKCDKSSDKPAPNHRKHARDTIDRTFTAPGTVGQRTTHRYDEGHISSRQRQLHGCTHDNQQSGQYQVHRSTYHIKSGPVSQNNLIFIEAAVNPTTYIYRNHTYQKIIDTRCTTHNHTCQCRRAEHLISFLLTSQVDRGLDYILGFFRSGQCIDHNHTGNDQENQRSLCGRHKGRHHEIMDTGSIRIGHIVCIGRKTGQRHTDKVNQVIPGKCQSQRKSPQQNYHLEDIHPTPVEHLHQHGKYHKTASHQHRGILLNPGQRFRSHERSTFKSIDNNKIAQRCNSYTAKYSNGPGKILFIVKAENQAGKILYHSSCDKSNGHRKEDTHNDRKRLFRIHHVAQTQQSGFIAEYFQYCQNKCTSQQFEHHGYSRGSRKPQCIEHIQQYHICYHYSQQDTHNLIEAEIYRMKDTMTRNIHHSITQYGTKEDTDSRHNNNCFKLCDFCPHRRIHKIHGVITNAHQQIKDRQHEQENNNPQINSFHICFAKFFPGAKIFHLCYNQMSYMLQFCYKIKEETENASFQLRHAWSKTIIDNVKKRYFIQCILY